MKHMIKAGLITLAAVGVCAAQGQYRTGSAKAAGSNLNMARVQTISGTVSVVNVGYGMQYPSITIGKVVIKMAPVWYLLDNNFEIKVGDALSIVAAPAASASDPYMYAVEMTKTATSLRLVLRDALGIPLWASPQTGRGPLTDGGCLVSSATASVSGSVEQINSGLGIQMPTLTVKSADGSLLTFKLGPERVLLASDLELKAGDLVTVKYASLSCCEDLVALAITNAAGGTVVLRDESGRPLW